MCQDTSIVIVGDAVAATGYSRVTDAIIRNLPQGTYDIHQLAVNYHGDPHNKTWKLYPASIGGDAYGVNRLNDLLQRLKPKLVFIVNDIPIIALYLASLKEHLGNFKIVTYSPVDGSDLDPAWLTDFSIVNRVVLYTEYARREVLKALHRKELSTLLVIPHGIENSVFFPYENGDAEATTFLAKRKLRILDEASLQNSFIVLNANRNQPRKRIDITIKGFSLFAKEKPDNVKLYLHMGLEDQGWNVYKLCERYGIDKRLILTYNRNDLPSICDEDLNLIYNACDVGINTCTAEGWGLPSCEHAATRKAQIVPRHSACKEIWNEAAVFLEPVLEITYEQMLVTAHFVSPEGVASALERLYSDKRYRAKVADACYERMSQPQYSWKNIAKRWDNLFQEVLSE